MVLSLLWSILPFGGCPCANTVDTFWGYKIEDIRLLLWLWRELTDLGLPVRMALGALVMAAAQAALQTVDRLPELWQRQTARVAIDWMLFTAGVLFAGPIWILANLTHNGLYYNDFRSVWRWLVLVPFVAHGEGLLMFVLPPGAPANVTLFDKMRQIVDLVWRMRQ